MDTKRKSYTAEFKLKAIYKAEAESFMILMSLTLDYGEKIRVTSCSATKNGVQIDVDMHTCPSWKKICTGGY